MDVSADHDALEVIVESFLARYRAGERPSIEEFTGRYPALAGSIRELLPALVLVEQDISITGPATRTGAGPGMAPAWAAATGASCELGDYRILREIGRGGMGVVYEAVQQSLGRHVALKVLPWSKGSKATRLERFRLEARSAARLHHTNIVPVFGVGEHDGTHYYAMQYIRGQGLDEVIDEVRRVRGTLSGEGRAVVDEAQRTRTQILAEGLRTGRFAPLAVSSTIDAGSSSGAWGAGIEARAEPPPVLPISQPAEAPLVQSSAPSTRSDHSDLTAADRPYFRAVARVGLQVAEALAYAHGQGVVHRDIKPSNLLLDTAGTVWVTDFGLAKAHDSDGDGPTQSGDILGTLQYMAPERFDGQSDPRSDLYGLGATLYELLTLRPAFQASSRGQLVDHILRREPVAPRSIDPRVPLDLAVICLKCLAKEPAKRYNSAAELAAELRRFLAGAPIRARRSGSLEHAWRWARRNPVVAGLVAALAASLVGGLLGVSWQWRRAEHEAAEARSQTVRAHAAARRADAAAATAAVAAGRAEQALASESQSLREARRMAARTALARGRSLADQGAVAQGMHWLVAALQSVPAEDRALARMVRANLAGYGRYLPRIRRVLPQVPRLDWPAFSPDGRRLVATIPLTDTPTEGEGGAPAEGLVMQWDTATGRPVGLPFHNSKGRRAVYRTDGRALVTEDRDQAARLWDVDAGSPLGQPMPSSRRGVRDLNFSPDGRFLLTASWVDRWPRLFDAHDGTPAGPPLVHDAPISARAFRPDGRMLVTGSTGGSLFFWDITAGAVQIRKADLGRPVRAIACSPDGKVVATTGENHEGLRFWDAATGRPLERRNVRPGNVGRLAYSPDGRLLLTIGDGGVWRFWDADDDRPLAYPLLRLADSFTAEFHPARPEVLIWGPEAGARILEVARHLWLATPLDRAAGKEPPLSVSRFTKPSERVAFDPERSRVVVQGTTHARIYSTADGQPRGRPIPNRWPNPGPVALSPDATTVAVVSHNLSATSATIDCAVALCDAATGRPLCPPINPIDSVVALAFSPDGRWLVTGDYADGIQFWDAATGVPVGSRWPQANIVTSLAFSPDGRRLAVGTSGDRGKNPPQVCLWDASTRQPLGPPVSYKGRGIPIELRFSADGETLATVGHPAKGWLSLNGRTGQPIAPGVAHEPQVPSLMVFRPDGQALLLATHEGTMELRDARTGASAGPSLSLPDELMVRVGFGALDFSPDGATIAAGYDDGMVRLWDAATGHQIGPPARHDRRVAGVAFTADGKTLVSVSEDGEVQSCIVPEPSTEPADRLALRLEVDTGMAFSAAEQEVVLLGPAAWEQRRRRLAESEPASDAVAPAPFDLEWHEATARFAERSGKGFTARFHLDRLIAAHPGDGLLWLRRAWVNAADGQLEAAEADLRTALSAGPRDACLDLLVHKAHEARQARRLALALWALDRVIGHRPADWQCYDDRAAIVEALGRPAQRDADRDRAVDLGADSLYLVRLARELDVQGQARSSHARAAALRDLAVARLEPGANPQMLLELAGDQFQRGHADRGTELMERLIAQSVTDAQKLRYRALARLSVGDRDGCAALLRAVTPAPGPDLTETMAWQCALGTAALADPAAVAELARVAQAWNTANQKPTAQQALGAALHRAGRHAEAVAALEMSGRHLTGQVAPQAWAFVALAYQAQGDANAARPWLEKLKDRMPSADPRDYWDELQIGLLQREAESATAAGDPVRPAP